MSALDRFGGTDIIVYNAGYSWDGVMHKTSDKQWAAMLDVHLTAPFRILRAAADFVRSATQREAEQGALVHRKVVNISSISGVCANAGQVNHAAAKAGIVGITRALAKEWGRYRVNGPLRCLRPHRYAAGPAAQWRYGLARHAGCRDCDRHSPRDA